MINRMLCAGLLTAAICCSGFATDRIVGNGTGEYKTLLAAYNAAASTGDYIKLKIDVSQAGFTIAKSVYIQNYYTSGTKKITLTSAAPLTVNANNVKFSMITVQGGNSSSGICITVNSGKSGFYMGNCVIQGPAQYCIKDLGSSSPMFYVCQFLNATEGIYFTSTTALEVISSNNVFNNTLYNMHAFKTAASSSGAWVTGATFTAGYSSTGTANYRSQCNVAGSPAEAMFEGCLFNAVTGGSDVYPIYLSGYSNCNAMSCTFNPCPNKAWKLVGTNCSMTESGGTHNSCAAP